MIHLISVTFIVIVFGAFSTGSPIGECPILETRDALVTLLPDDVDCSALWVCDNGVAVSFQCPSGLVFNSALGVCDWPNSEEDACAELTTELALQTTVEQITDPATESTTSLESTTYPPTTTAQEDPTTDARFVPTKVI